MHRRASFEEFLDAHLGQEMLRFTTAGSVDDGKSTLIGRLLHDTKSIYEDQLAAVKNSRVNRAAKGHVDFSLLTDGLKAEREQGITIDVAYRYFSTTRRKFIIADTPGHEQYTRNMATGASTADVAIILIDANAYQKAGQLLPQSRRHTYIASLLGIPHVVAAVNKMDLVGYSRGDLQRHSARLRSARDAACAARHHHHSRQRARRRQRRHAERGDALVHRPHAARISGNSPARRSPTPKAPCASPCSLSSARMPNFRGFAGQVARGTLRAGDRVMALPSRRETTVSRLVTYDGDLAAASHPQSITVELEDEIDLSRGEMLVPAADAASPSASSRLRAMVVWMHEQPLQVGRTYLAKHTTRTVRATVRAIKYRVDVNTLDHINAQSLAMNEIAEVEFETNLPLFFDSYAACRATGSLILIDRLSNATVGAAMITAAVEGSDASGHAGLPSLILVPGRADLAQRILETLAARGEQAVLIDDQLIPDSAVAAAVRALDLAGVIAISARTLPQPTIDAIDNFVSGSVVVEDSSNDGEILKRYVVTA